MKKIKKIGQMLLVEMQYDSFFLHAAQMLTDADES